MTRLALALLVALLAASAHADMYMHNPRGSNNRLNGNGNNRANNNRLCDTQNNAKGGYCWGPKMYYYVGSQLSVEWTNQHGCGSTSDKVNCEIVIQYMCGDDVRDGTTTTEINNNNWQDTDQNGNYLYGMHENKAYSDACTQRERNKGLFTADRNVNNNNGARATRQNNNGNQSGFECAEERDYYPYWHHTPWKDIAVLTYDTSRCPYYQSESQNVQRKGKCSNGDYGMEGACTANGGTFEFDPAWGIAAPECVAAPWSRVNHLGNGVGGFPNTYNWTIPNDPHQNCVLRVRYNISTEDGGKPFWGLTAKDNDGNSPVKQNPYVPFLGKELRLAINTAQFGRTFQDRSHVFEIRSRPAGVDPTRRIHNLNVKGKRGNIVQTYPATEYDFTPNLLRIRTGDYVHFQWTGCDNNPAGNAGEGTAKTDRSNIVPLVSAKWSIFKDYGDTKIPQIFSQAQAELLAHLGQTGCQNRTGPGSLEEEHNNNQGNINQDVDNCAKLNAAPRYFDGGLVKVDKAGQYNYMSSRNNNFTNRGQKAVMTSSELVETWGIVLLVIASVGFAAAIVVALVVKCAPGSSIAAAAQGV